MQWVFIKIKELRLIKLSVVVIIIIIAVTTTIIIAAVTTININLRIRIIEKMMDKTNKFSLNFKHNLFWLFQRLNR